MLTVHVMNRCSSAMVYSLGFGSDKKGQTPGKITTERFLFDITTMSRHMQFGGRCVKTDLNWS